MTADEALTVIETALDYDRLNKVQELVFRHVWEGKSYLEIAKVSGYEYDYIKDAGAKLWKQLSKAFGEKVKKTNLQSVVKRYLHQTQINFLGNAVIAVNLSATNLTNTTLNIPPLNKAKLLFTQLNTPYPHPEIQDGIIDNHHQFSSNQQEILPLDENSIPENQPTSDNKTDEWNGWQFPTEAHLKIAETLENTGTFFTFYPQRQTPIAKRGVSHITTEAGKQNLQFDFLIFHQGKWGILQIDTDTTTLSPQNLLSQNPDIRIIQHYQASLCIKNPAEIVQEFLKILTQTKLI